jgi:hypothetical protein
MMETTEVSETSVNKNLTPGKYPKESTLQAQASLSVPFEPVTNTTEVPQIVSLPLQQ